MLITFSQVKRKAKKERGAHVWTRLARGKRSEIVKSGI